jgi:hypothetical protein
MKRPRAGSGSNGSSSVAANRYGEKASLPPPVIAVIG